MEVWPNPAAKCRTVAPSCVHVYACREGGRGGRRREGGGREKSGR